MGVDGDRDRRQTVPPDPLHCSDCGCEISAAEAMASRREYGRYLCLACIGAGEELV